MTLTKTFPDVRSVSGPGSVTRRSVVWENGPDSGRHTELSARPIMTSVGNYRIDRPQSGGRTGKTLH